RGGPGSRPLNPRLPRVRTMARFAAGFGPKEVCRSPAKRKKGSRLAPLLFCALPGIQLVTAGRPGRPAVRWRRTAVVVPAPISTMASAPPAPAAASPHAKPLSLTTSLGGVLATGFELAMGVVARGAQKAPSTECRL